MTNTKTSLDGRVCLLGSDVFVWRSRAKTVHAKNHPHSMLRLISGVDGRDEIGYHFAAGYVTVCLVDVEHATFLGVKRTELRKLSADEAARLAARVAAVS